MGEGKKTKMITIGERLEEGSHGCRQKKKRRENFQGSIKLGRKPGRGIRKVLRGNGFRERGGLK